MDNKQTKLPSGKMLALGASVAALGAATYYFFGPEGKKHQKNFQGWMIKMKADIIEKIEDAGEVTEPIYDKIVDEVAMAYSKTGKISKEDIMPYADILKRQWKHIVKATKSPAKRATAAKKTAKKAVKKTAKKAARKMSA